MEFFFDLFDFTSFFAWTFLNFLARCGACIFKVINYYVAFFPQDGSEKSFMTRKKTDHCVQKPKKWFIMLLCNLEPNPEHLNLKLNSNHSVRFIISQKIWKKLVKWKIHLVSRVWHFSKISGLLFNFVINLSFFSSF